MTNYDWIQWVEVKAGSRYFDSADVEIQAQVIINEACQTVLDDLSGYYNLTMLTAVGVPAQLKRLALLKARELAAFAYYGTPSSSTEKNETAAYYRDEYKFLLESIRQGYIEVEGYDRKITNKTVMYY